VDRFVTTDVKAEMPGCVFEILVSEGSDVAVGDPLLIIESMKMEIVVSAPSAGRVAQLCVSLNQVVEADQVLARLAV
jgi:urea carboxylase